MLILTADGLFYCMKLCRVGMLLYILRCIYQ